MNARQLKTLLAKKYKREYFDYMSRDIDMDVEEVVRDETRLELIIEILVFLAGKKEAEELELLTELEWEKRVIIKRRGE